MGAAALEFVSGRSRAAVMVEESNSSSKAAKSQNAGHATDWSERAVNRAEVSDIDSLCELLRRAGVKDEFVDKTLATLNSEDVGSVRDLRDLRTAMRADGEELGALLPRLTAMRLNSALDALAMLSVPDIDDQVRPQAAMVEAQQRPAECAEQPQQP